MCDLLQWNEFGWFSISMLAFYLHNNKRLQRRRQEEKKIGSNVVKFYYKQTNKQTIKYRVKIPFELLQG